MHFSNVETITNLKLLSKPEIRWALVSFQKQDLCSDFFNILQVFIHVVEIWL